VFTLGRIGKPARVARDVVAPASIEFVTPGDDHGRHDGRIAIEAWCAG